MPELHGHWVGDHSQCDPRWACRRPADPVTEVLAGALVVMLAALLPDRYRVMYDGPAAAVGAWAADINSGDLGRVRRAYGLPDR